MCVAFSFLRFLPQRDPSSLSTPSIIRSPRFSLAKHISSRSQRSNIGRMPSTRWGRRGEGRGEEGNKRKGRGKSKGGKRRKRNFLFCRAREATFPVQEATAKKVYLGLFPTACFPAIRIFTLPLRTRRHRVFYWHEFQSHSLHCFFLISECSSSKDPSNSFTEESEIFISVRTFMKIFIFRLSFEMEYFHQFYFLLLCIKIFNASTSTSNWIVVDCFIGTILILVY